MPDKINEKVINMFSQHKKHCPVECNEKIVMCENGYYYVCINKDDHNLNFDAKKLIERRDYWYYIVKVLIETDNDPIIHNYKVHGDKLHEFLLLFAKQQKEGLIIEIDKFSREEPA